MAGDTATFLGTRDFVGMIAHLPSRSLPLAVLFTFLAAAPAGVAAADKPPSDESVEAGSRLQVFLDRAEFAPGKIDGRFGEFTKKALALYREAKGKPPGPASSESGAASKNRTESSATPEVSDLDLASIDPVFLSYTVTDVDLRSIGDLPTAVPEQAKKKSLPYRTAAEAIAEKFHTDVDFLALLNPGKTKSIKAGDLLRVPNVEPFQLPDVKELKAGSEIPSLAANDVDDAGNQESRNGGRKSREGDHPAATMSVKVDTQNSMLGVYQNDELIAAYPVTVGSAQTASPIGDWTVRGVATMPNFRYDESMLNKGERSSKFHLLPPGPNNPVGVVWIQLNKKGIGLHGTSDPDAIGRNASHGCVRLANWDIVRLAAKVKAGMPVSIR